MSRFARMFALVGLALLFIAPSGWAQSMGLFGRKGWGRIVNETGRNIGIWGDKNGLHDFSGYDNQTYTMKPGQTPDNWDCDGFYVPADMKVVVMTPLGQGKVYVGPVAIKISNGNLMRVRRNGNTFEINENPTDVLRPDNVSVLTGLKPGTWYINRSTTQAMIDKAPVEM